ncbi:unnamed protein product [Anisakis simplex]|uniref:Coat protein n=1 Tax=Anisakis simplex TaxID=6269 RepID=A0A0M3KBD2_ANISI|nr:unnamed protein product [Anisakis simplex]
MFPRYAPFVSTPGSAWQSMVTPLQHSLAASSAAVSANNDLRAFDSG